MSMHVYAHLYIFYTYPTHILYTSYLYPIHIYALLYHVIPIHTNIFQLKGLHDFPAFTPSSLTSSVFTSAVPKDSQAGPEKWVTFGHVRSIYYTYLCMCIFYL